MLSQPNRLYQIKVTLDPGSIAGKDTAEDNQPCS
jgi:hypothetical protein